MLFILRFVGNPWMYCSQNWHLSGAFPFLLTSYSYHPSVCPSVWLTSGEPQNGFSWNLVLGSWGEKMIGPFRLWLKCSDNNRHHEWRPQAFYELLGINMACISRNVRHSEGIWSRSCRGKRSAHSVFCALFLASVAVFEIIKGGRNSQNFFFNMPVIWCHGRWCAQACSKHSVFKW